MAAFKASPEKRSQPRPLTRPRRNPPPAAGLTERESFFRSKPKREEIMATEYQTEDKIPPRRAL